MVLEEDTRSIEASSLSKPSCALPCFLGREARSIEVSFQLFGSFLIPFWGNSLLESVLSPSCEHRVGCELLSVAFSSSRPLEDEVLGQALLSPQAAKALTGADLSATDPEIKFRSLLLPSLIRCIVGKKAYAFSCFDFQCSTQMDSTRVCVCGCCFEGCLF